MSRIRLEGTQKVSGGCLIGFQTNQVKNVQVRTGAVRTGQVRTGQIRTGQVMTGQIRTGQVKIGQVRTVQVRTYTWNSSVALLSPTCSCVLSIISQPPF